MYIYRKRLKNTLLFILTLVIILSSPTNTWGQAVEEDLSPEEALRFFVETIDYIRANYPFQVSNEELINNSIRGMLQGLDDNSNFYTGDEADNLLKNLSGNYAGIGVVIEKQDDQVRVNSLIKDSPAQKVGLKPGDVIISVDDMEIENLDLNEVSNLIRGLADTKVRLGIIREDKSLPLYIDIVRKNIKVNPVEYEILENQIGYIKLREFNAHATSSMKNALIEMDKENIDRIILDLRDNPGGQLNQAINIGQLFVPAGPLVHIRNKEGLTTHISTKKNPKYKLAVLINENSASASEILAGAIKEREAGILIGNKSYGKGTVQSLLPIRDGKIIKLTTAEYLLPKKTSIHKIGIEPHIQIGNEEGKDLQLEKAVDLLDHWGHSPESSTLLQGCVPLP